MGSRKRQTLTLYHHVFESVSAEKCQVTGKKHLLMDGEIDLWLSSMEQCMGQWWVGEGAIAQGSWEGGALHEVTLAAQKPLALPVMERPRLKRLPSTMHLKVLPMMHRIRWGIENLQTMIWMSFCCRRAGCGAGGVGGAQGRKEGLEAMQGEQAHVGYQTSCGQFIQ